MKLKEKIQIEIGFGGVRTVKRFSNYQGIGLVVMVALLATTLGCRPMHESGRPGSVTAPQGASSSVTTPGNITSSQQALPWDWGDSEVEYPAAGAVQMDLVAIELELPLPAFAGTPVPLNEPNVRKPSGKPRGPFFAPKGTVNLARGGIVLTSDPAPSSGELDYINNGEKEASDFGYLELRPGSEWVQIDLGQEATVFGVLVWHNHADARVYRDVIVQVSNDPDFLGPKTVFNNDYDNSSGMGIGSDMGYVETSEGGLIDCRGIEGRYVRLYSNGSTVDPKNHYTEVEVYGIPMQ